MKEDTRHPCSNICFRRIEIFVDFHTPTFHTHLLAQRAYSRIVKQLKELVWLWVVQSFGSFLRHTTSTPRDYSLLELTVPFIKNAKQTSILHSILTSDVVKMRAWTWTYRWGTRTYAHKHTTERTTDVLCNNAPLNLSVAFYLPILKTESTREYLCDYKVQLSYIY